MIITQEGYNKLVNEINNLVNIDLKEATLNIENNRPIGVSDEFPQEYLDAIENQDRITRKLSYLKNLQKDSVIFEEYMIKDKQKAGFGAIVEIINLDNDKKSEYKIVSSYESDVNNGLLSIESPLAKEMIGMNVGSYIAVNDNEYEILSIKY